MSRLTFAIVMIAQLVLAHGCFKPSTNSPHRQMHLWRTQPAPQSSAKNSAETSTADANSPRTIDLPEAIQIALRHSPMLALEKANYDYAAAKASEDAQLDNPELRVMNVNTDKLRASEANLSLAMRVPVPQPWAHNALAQRVALQAQASKAHQLDSERIIRARVEKLFAQLTMLNWYLQELELAIEAGQKQKKIIEDSAQAGAATSLETSQTLMRYAELYDEQYEQRMRRGETIAELRQMLGLTSLQPVEFQTSRQMLSLVQVKSSEEELIKTALNQRQDLRVATARVGAAEADAFVERSRRWPWFRFAELEYKFNDPNPGAVQFSVALELPLFSLNGGGVAAQEARLNQRRAEEQAAIIGVVREIQENFQRANVSYKWVTEMQQSLVPAMNKSNQTINEAQQHSLIDPKQAIDLRWRHLQALRRYLKALLEHKIALVDLRAAAGEVSVN